ncbi:alpha/beta hydrolase [Flexivirga endophytica]|uniref:Alpha/beta hydrolase n=1 Tax=Flexivirga endophytica TaxID=1849103 RepID=A0A916SXY9_9MICO|nr:alpha/beta hydrolase [Flexivirga endophytica]GGB21367.1 alpha/beta hydrolase [Flexivirga endophytica]GHB59033.1 alpha/beta hydrolase [Flexivirga endophytica]
MNSSVLRRAIAPAAGVTTGVGAAVGGGTLGVSSYFARQLVTPVVPVDDTPVLEVGAHHVALAVTEDSIAPGRYGMWQNDLETHARLGDVLDISEDRVTRRLDGIDFGALRPGKARFDGYYFCGPPATSLPVELDEVALETSLGPMPTWVDRVPGSDRWAVLVHGRGALRGETLRAVPVLHELGISSLVPSYRNDIGSPASSDHRYHLGLSEWADVEAAVLYAASAGAREVQLFGWSMGAAVVLQFLDRSWLAELVDRVVFDSPVVSWGPVLDFHAGEHRLPRLISRVGARLLRSRLHGQAAGLGEPIDIRLTDWVRRADELSRPMLLIHSAVDEFVPYAPTAALAAARPDLVQLETWDVARHCREWNVDPDRWERLVAEFCSARG